MNKRINKKFKIGLAHGVFDILHIGHIEYFKKAKTYCDKLLVSVTEDKFVNKGPNRPAFKISERVKMLKSIKYIDQVIVSKKPTSVDIIKRFKPDIYIKGKDYEDLVLNPNKNLKLEMDAIKKSNGKFLIIDTKLKSSSKILNENFNYLDSDVRSFLKNIDKEKFSIKLKDELFKTHKKKILVIGEPIIDIHCNVKVLGKSQKSNVVSTNFVKNEYEKKYSIKSKKIIVLPSGSSIKENYKYKFNNKKLSIGYFGSLYKSRGIDLIFKLALIDPKNDYYI